MDGTNISLTSDSGYLLKVSSITGNDHQITFNAIDDDFAAIEVKTLKDGELIGNTDLRVMPIDNVGKWITEVMHKGLNA